METIEDLGLEPIVEEKRASEAQQQTQRTAMRALNAKWGKEHAGRVDALTRELLLSAPDAPSDEVMLLRTAANASAVAEALARAQLQLTTRIERLIDNPKVVLTIARALREVTTTQTASVKSFQELVEAASTLRAQRAIARAHTAKEVWHAQVGGAVDSSRRDSPRRHPSPN